MALALSSLCLVHKQSCFFRLGQKLKREVEKTDGEVTNLAIAFDELQKDMDEYTRDPVDEHIREAKQKVFDEWIENIANYSPYNGGQ